MCRKRWISWGRLLASTGYTQPGVDPKLADFFKIGEGGAQIGLPYAVYPSYIFYNKDLFDEAGLPYPPSKIGDQYEGKPWDMEAVAPARHEAHGRQERQRRHEPELRSREHRAVGLRRPVPRRQRRGRDRDVRGRPAGRRRRQDRRDPGLHRQRREVVQRRDLEGPLHPDGRPGREHLLNAGGEFASGNLAMNEGHTWFTCCITPTAPAKPVQLRLRGAARLQRGRHGPAPRRHLQHAQDQQGPGRGVQGPDGHGRIARAPDHLWRHAGRPGQAGSLDKSIDKNFPGIKLDWDVVKEALGYPDIPNNQAFVPNYGEAKAAFQAFQNKIRTTSGWTWTRSSPTLKTTLQGIFDKPAN